MLCHHKGVSAQRMHDAPGLMVALVRGNRACDAGWSHVVERDRLDLDELAWAGAINTRLIVHL